MSNLETFLHRLSDLRRRAWKEDRPRYAFTLEDVEQRLRHWEDKKIRGAPLPERQETPRRPSLMSAWRREIDQLVIAEMAELKPEPEKR